MKRVIDLARKIFLSICVSAGMLALANIETIWQEYHHAKLQEDLSQKQSAQGFTYKKDNKDGRETSLFLEQSLLTASESDTFNWPSR